MSDLSFKNWQVELIRVTGFYGQISTEKKLAWSSWWTDLVGVPPENTTLRKRDDLFQEEGPFNGGNLILAIQPGRIDWYLKALTDGQEEEQSDSPGLAFLKPEAIAKFHDLIAGWMKLNSCPSLIRLAVGCVLLQPVQSREAAYLQLRNYLHAVDLKPEARDFIYQINRPRESRSVPADLQINRLSKWSVPLRGKVAFSISLGTKDKSAMAGSFEGQGQFACRVELDINTAQDYKGEFSGNDLLTVFDELVTLAREISEKGDVS